MIVISPWSRKLRNGKDSPKDYPHWVGLLKLLSQYDDIVQLCGPDKGEIRLVGNCKINLPLDELAEKYILPCNLWISVDNFLQHMAYHLHKPGIVIWGPSDPAIFGYKENLNIVKNKSYFRPNQFVFWEQCVPNQDAFYKPHEIIYILQEKGLIK